MSPLALPGPADIIAARDRLRPILRESPLFELAGTTDATVLVKAECLQPTGSFKARGAGNLIHSFHQQPELLYTASAGNMALAMAWHARRLGIKAAAVVPDSAPAAKTERLSQLGAQVVPVPYHRWWQAMLEGHYPEFAHGQFVHPFADPAVVAGNAVIGLEIAAEEPDLDAVVVPFGGGGLALGIACGLRTAGSTAPVYAAEIETAAPLSRALAAGHPVAQDRQPSFVDGIGGNTVSDQIWAHARDMLAGAIVVDVPASAAALRRVLAEQKILLEGASSTAVAAAGRLGGERHRRVVAIGSGGNIDLGVVGQFLAEPSP